MKLPLLSSIYSFAILLSMALLVHGDTGYFRVSLNNTAVESNAPVASPSSLQTDESTESDFGDAAMTVYFNSESSANVILTLNLNNFSNVDNVVIYQGGANTPSGGNALFNITPNISLDTLNTQNPANLTFLLEESGVIDFDALYANPTNYFLEISNSLGGIKGQFEDATPGFTPEGVPDISTNNILRAELTFVNPPSQFRGINFYNAIAQLFFVPLNDSSYNLEFYITSYANDTSSLELYNIKFNETLYDFTSDVRFPSLDHNYNYRGHIDSFSQTLSSQLLTSPQSYGFRITTTVNGTKLLLAGVFNTVTSLTPPPPSPVSSPPPPVSVDPGRSIGARGSGNSIKVVNCQTTVVYLLSLMMLLHFIFH